MGLGIYPCQRLGCRAEPAAEGPATREVTDPRAGGSGGPRRAWSAGCRVPGAGWTGMRDRAGHAEPRTCDGSSTPLSLEEAEHGRAARGRPFACILYPTPAPFLPRFFASSGSSRLGAPQSNTSSFCRSKMNALATKSFNGQALAASSRRTTASARSALVVRAGRIVRRISVHIERIDRVMAHSAIHPLRRRGCRPVAFYHRD